MSPAVLFLRSGSDQPPPPVADVVPLVVADVVLPVPLVTAEVVPDVVPLVDEVVELLPPEPESSPQAAMDIASPVSTVNRPAIFMKRIILSVFLPRLEPKPCSK